MLYLSTVQVKAHYTRKVQNILHCMWCPQYNPEPGWLEHQFVCASICTTPEACWWQSQMFTQFQLNGHVFVIQYFVDLFYETGFVQFYQIKIQGLFKDNIFFLFQGLKITEVVSAIFSFRIHICPLYKTHVTTWENLWWWYFIFFLLTVCCINKYEKYIPRLT